MTVQILTCHLINSGKGVSILFKIAFRISSNTQCHPELYHPTSGLLASHAIFEWRFKYHNRIREIYIHTEIDAIFGFVYEVQRMIDALFSEQQIAILCIANFKIRYWLMVYPKNTIHQQQIDILKKAFMSINYIIFLK